MVTAEKMAFDKISSRASSSVFRPEWVAKKESFPGDSRIVIASDLEGPHFLGDTALNCMSVFVKPDDDRRFSPTDYGAILYEQTYQWFEKNIKNQHQAQEAADIALTLAPLLAKGANEADIVEEAKKSTRMKGSEQLLQYLNDKGALVVGVTTAWEAPHKDLVIEAGFDGIVGTHFKVDTIRNFLIKKGVYGQEMQMTNNFLNEAFVLIDQLGTAVSEEERRSLGQKLEDRIGNFYLDELGITYDHETRKQKNRDRDHKTALGWIIESIDVIGDQRKAKVADSIFKYHARPDDLQVAIGDGYNDCIMLKTAPWSIAVNAPKAARSAKIGVITDDMGVVVELLEIMRLYPDAAVDEIVNIAQEVVEGRAIIHKGGPEVSDETITEHSCKKKEVRGKGSLIP